MDFLTDIKQIGSWAYGIWDEFVSMIGNAIIALQTFSDILDEFDDRIVDMKDNCGTAEFDGFPIKEAIGTFRYVCGDIIFYLLYLLILIGCLFVIYKLVVLLYHYIRLAVTSIMDYFGGKSLSSILPLFFGK